MGKTGRSLYNSVYFITAICFVLAIIINFIYFASISSQNKDEDNIFHTCKRCTLHRDVSKERHPSSEEEAGTSQHQAVVNSKAPKLKDSEETQAQNEEDWIDVESQSDRRHVYVAVNGIKVYDIDELNDRWRGLHVIVLNQYTGALMASNVFDFYGGAENPDIVRFLSFLRRGRIVVFLVKDEGSHGFKAIGRNAVRSFGCRLVHQVGFRDNWVCIGRRNNKWVTENIEKYTGGDRWPHPVRARVSLKLEKKSDVELCYGENKEASKRRLFCETYEGYENVCECNNDKDLYKKPPGLVNNNVAEFPVVIIASKRPRYLFRMLRKLLSVAGADPSMITVFVDGFYNETNAVADLFGLKVVVNDIQCAKNCRIQQHYKKSLSKTFNDFPHAKCAIILEEDLEVSEDIFDYFSQTYPLLESDKTIYCISAWNDQGYQHSVHDPSLLYRVETMPGLGW